MSQDAVPAAACNTGGVRTFLHIQAQGSATCKWPQWRACVVSVMSNRFSNQPTNNKISQILKRYAAAKMSPHWWSCQTLMNSCRDRLQAGKQSLYASTRVCTPLHHAPSSVHPPIERSCFHDEIPSMKPPAATGDMVRCTALVTCLSLAR
jgi:hypothetical protein